MYLADTWSLGVLIGLPAFLVGLLIFTTLAVVFIHGAIVEDSWDAEPLWVVGIGAAIVSIVILGAGLWGFYPYHTEYHKWIDKTGTVEKVSSRVLGNKDSFQQKYVVRYTSGEEYGCTDTRCSLIKVGDRLTVTCKRVWQFTGQDGYDCNYVRNEGRQ